MTSGKPLTPPSAQKIHTRHLDRLAVVYVRQSTPQQVVCHRESADLQYQLRRRATEFGWAESRVLVIDDDQGVSGQSVENRPGFQRLLAEISLGHVGIVFGREMSRLARSCKDWHQLLELCALFQVVLADADGVYDPADHNDRMLLGLRGMMSEAELHVLRSRLHQGKLNKARRGELFSFVPIGYVRTPDGGVALDPDEQARSAVRMVFEKVAELGSARQAHAFLIAHDIRLGVRLYRGPDKGALTWRRPRLSTIYDMLRHPFYAGAYVYGRCQVDRAKQPGGKPGRRSAPPDEWVSLLQGRVPAYISWEQYEENRRRMAENDRGRGASKKCRRTSTLLNRIAWCGRCGRPIAACKTHEIREPRYVCDPDHYEGGGPPCQSMAALPVDGLIESLVLEAVQPAALELSLRAAEQAGRDRDRLHANWRQKVERANYEAERARRQYDAAEPENRLVTRELERRWEEKLAEARRVEEDYSRFQAEQPRELTAAERERIRALASDLPALWEAATTRGADRRAVVRLLIDRVELTRRGDSELIDVVVYWRGGAQGRHVVRQGLQSYQRLGRFAELKERVSVLRKEGKTGKQIAEVLNAEGFVPPRGQAFSDGTVRRLFARFGLTGLPAGLGEAGDGPGRGEWWLPALAAELGVEPIVLHRWLRSGYLLGRQLAGGKSRWIVWANAAERRRLRKLRSHERAHHGETPPAELTTPTKREKRKCPGTGKKTGEQRGGK
jgi:DNA invertase Pin-like site-specific DNA recombinase